MVELHVLNGYCTIQLRRKIGGCNLWPDSIIWDLCPCGNVLVGEDRFLEFDRYVWVRKENLRAQSYYAVRSERQGKVKIDIIMAREILGLTRSPGHGGDVADHRNHDIRDNTLENLRIADHIQSGANRRIFSKCHRFKGIQWNKDKYQARVHTNGSKIYFSNVLVDVEAALMYNYGAYLVFNEYAKFNVIPEDEMPTYERQWELYDLVVAKLRVKGFPCEDAMKREEFDLCV